MLNSKQDSYKDCSIFIKDFNRCFNKSNNKNNNAFTDCKIHYDYYVNCVESNKKNKK